MRTTVKISLKTNDCQAVVSTIDELLETHGYTMLELPQITVWHKRNRYFAVSFRDNAAFLQGWLELLPRTADGEPIRSYSYSNEHLEEVSLHSLRNGFVKRKQLKLLSALETAILEKKL